MEFATIIILAITVEALIEYVKLIFVQKAVNWKQVAALIMGVALSILAGTDLYALVGVGFAVPYVGSVLTGIIFSRGANYVSDFIGLIQGARSGKQIETAKDERIDEE